MGSLSPRNSLTYINARYGRHSSILLMPIFKNDTVCVNLLLQHGSFSNLSYDDILSPISSLAVYILVTKSRPQRVPSELVAETGFSGQ
jgi:hypothetical protein